MSKRTPTFEDVVFKKHPNIPGAISGNIILENEYELSIVAGPSLYSLPGGLTWDGEIDDPSQVDKFEVAIINAKGQFIDETMGWQTRDQITVTIAETAAIKNTIH